MKNIKINQSIRRVVASYFSIVALFIGFSCNDIITEDPISIATANGHYTNERGILDGLNSVYTPLRSIPLLVGSQQLMKFLKREKQSLKEKPGF